MVETLTWVAAALFAGLAISSWLQYRRDKSSGSFRLAALFALVAVCSLVVEVLRFLESR